MFKHIIRLGEDESGFSLLEVVITIIIIGLALSAITESFIVGSAKSVNIASEETAMNASKKTISDLDYCRDGGTVGGVCVAFKKGFWNNPSNYYTTPQGPTIINGRCIYLNIVSSCVVFSNSNNGGSIKAGTCGHYIQTVVRTGWFAPDASGQCPSSPPPTYPFITISNIYANY